MANNTLGNTQTLVAVGAGLVLVLALPFIPRDYVLYLIPVLLIALGAWRLLQGKSGLLLLLIGVVLFLVGVSALTQFGTNVVTIVEDIADGGETRQPVVGGNGIITIRPGGTDSFLVDGPVAIRNYRNYCVGVSPRGVFKMTENANARIVYIEPRSRGETIQATVTIKRAEDCGHH